MAAIRNTVILFLASAAIPAICAPVPANGLEPTYVPEPRRRGTLGLFWSCAVTYGICIWTAVHKDIVPFVGVKHRLYYKLLWVFTAFVLPEFLLIIALSQLRQAMKVRDHWRKRFPDTLGLQGGFFLVMGGYTIKRSASPEKPEMLITLTENGFKKLVESIAEIVPDQPQPSIFKRILKDPKILIGKGLKRPKSEAELRKEANLQELAARFLENPFDKELIEDKGKADSISKTIVSFQALWMLLQCITRKANGLPITLAETHVAIQIVYAAFMYGCWWFKPLDVSVPISIPADDKLWSLFHTKKEVTSETETTPTTEEEARPLLYSLETTSNNRPSVRPGESLFQASYASLSLPISRQNESDYKQTDLYDKDMPIVIEYTEWNHYNMIYRMCHVVFSGFAYNQDHRQHRSELVGMALSALNGLLHGLAWNSHFPSPTEAVLWKLSCFGIALCPLATYFVSLRGPCIEAAVIAVWDIRFRGQFCGKDKAKTTSMVAAWRDYRHARYHSARMIEAKVTRGQFEVEESRRENGRPEWRWLLTVDIVWLMFLGYTMSIMYFAVEAFISIRSLPAGSYDLPSWANLLPHI